MADIQLDTEEKFRALIEHSTDIVSVLDEDGTILYQSPSVQRVLGYEQGTIRGDSAFEYVHPDDREAVVEAFTRLVQGERSKTERVEFRFRDAEGSWVWLEAVGSNQTHTALDGYVITSRDITERKERERALERKNERLDEFASIVSHDLRNPLRVVEGSIELYHETGDENHYERSLDGIERMRRLIDDLLVLARYGDSVVDPEPVDLSDVAADALGMVQQGGADCPRRTHPGSRSGTAVPAPREPLRERNRTRRACRVSHRRHDAVGLLHRRRRPRYQRRKTG